VPTKLPV